MLRMRDYRLFRLALDSNDKTAFALGTTSADNYVWLLSFPVPTKNNERIQFNQIKKLQDLRYNDDCKLNLVETEGEGGIKVRTIIISAPRGVIMREDLK